VYEPEGQAATIVGQIHQSQVMPSAHLNYLLMTDESDPDDLVTMLEGLIQRSGQWGAKQVIADLATDSEYFPQFRQAGFSVLAKQRVFKCAPPLGNGGKLAGHWRIWTSDDIAAMRNLYMTLVPPLVQHIEPLTRREMLGLVYYDQSGTLMAYADLVYGPVGAWVLPLIHPLIKEDGLDLLTQMLVDLPPLNGRPVYVTVSSYQPWVEQAMVRMAESQGQETALLVRYIAMRQRIKADFSFTNLENGKPEPTVPLTPINNHQE